MQGMGCGRSLPLMGRSMGAEAVVVLLSVLDKADAFLLLCAAAQHLVQPTGGRARLVFDVDGHPRRLTEGVRPCRHATGRSKDSRTVAVIH